MRFGMARLVSLLMRKRPENRVQNFIEPLADVFGEETQHKVAGLLFVVRSEAHANDMSPRLGTTHQLFNCVSTHSLPQAQQNRTGSATPGLKLANTIELPGVKGGFDLMAADVAGHRLFVTGQDNNTVEVLDIKNGKPLASIPGFRQPKGIVYVADAHKLYVSNKDDDVVDILDSESFRRLGQMDFTSNANNVYFDSRSRTVYVGYGDGAIGSIKTADDTRGPDVALASYPKQFRLERDGPRIFVDAPAAVHVAVIDHVQNKVVATRPIRAEKGNVPMALDESHPRLTVACEPGRFVVINIDSGASVSSLAIKSDADGIQYHASRDAAYVSCGEGFLHIIRRQDPDAYEVIQTLPTVAGAGTSLWVPEWDRLFLTVPQTKDRPAAIHVFAPTSPAGK